MARAGTAPDGVSKRAGSSPSPPESRSIVSATTTMGLFKTWARTKTWNSSRLSYTGSSELSTLGEAGKKGVFTPGVLNRCISILDEVFLGSDVEEDRLNSIKFDLWFEILDVDPQNCLTLREGCSPGNTTPLRGASGSLFSPEPQKRCLFGMAAVITCPWNAPSALQNSWN